MPVSLGADPVVTYDELDEVGRVDVVLDPVGGELFTTLPRPARSRSARRSRSASPAGHGSRSTRAARRPQLGVAGFYLGRLIQLEPEPVRIAAEDVLGLWRAGGRAAGRRRALPARQAAEPHSASSRSGARPERWCSSREGTRHRRRGGHRRRDRRAAPRRTATTSGARPRDRLRRDRPGRVGGVEAVDLAVLNAGVLTGEADVAVSDDEAYRRAVAVNVDGVVLGVRRLARVMRAAARRSSPPRRSAASSGARGPGLRPDEVRGGRLRAHRPRRSSPRAGSAQRGLPLVGGHAAGSRRASREHRRRGAGGCCSPRTWPTG